MADAPTWSTNVGHPGTTNAAVDDVFYKYLVPQMFAQAATGRMTAGDSVKATETQMKTIFDSWRSRNKI